MSEQRPELTDEDLAAINYMDTTYTRSFRLGQYEPDCLIDGILENGTYELGDRLMYVNDPAWGEAVIGDEPHDQLLIQLARTPLFRRLQSIEQLTLGPDYATMPNGMYLSRWQHIWGSLLFVRKMVEGRTDIDPREKMVLQLRTLLSDVAHTAFSHLGDWMFQGIDGGENLHDSDLKEVLHVTGVEAILQKHGFDVEETVFPETKDWVECPSPDLCVDRVDYGFREVLRWGVPTIPLHLYRRESEPGQLFRVDEQDRLVMRSQRMARYFSAGFSLLSTEHWAHPVHRLQLQLLESAVRSSVIDKVLYDGVHPRDAMYGIDNDFSAHFHTWDMLHAHNTMRQIALAQRRIFTSARRADLEMVFGGIQTDDWEFPEFPDPLRPYSWQSRHYGYPYPPQLIIEPADKSTAAETFQATSRGLEVYLPPLKARSIDPLVVAAKGIARFSDLEPSYREYLAGQRTAMAVPYIATVLMRPDVAERIVEHKHKTDKLWPELVSRPRRPDVLGRIIRESEGYAAAARFDVIEERSDTWINQRRPNLGGFALQSEAGF